MRFRRLLLLFSVFSFILLSLFLEAFHALSHSVSVCLFCSPLPCPPKPVQRFFNILHFLSSQYLPSQTALYPSSFPGLPCSTVCSQGCIPTAHPLSSLSTGERKPERWKCLRANISTVYLCKIVSDVILTGMENVHDILFYS